MAHGLGIEVIAEGVENIEQVAMLSEYDCDMFQGYYYAKPMPFNEMLKLDSPQIKIQKKLKLIKGS